MLHPVLEQLKHLKLTGMLEALEAQEQQSSISQFSFIERLALLVENEVALRKNKKLKRSLENAKLKTSACFEDISFNETRGLDKLLLMSLENCQWINNFLNITISAATGTGKTYLAEALAHKACLKGYSSLNVRLSRFLEELTQTRAEGNILKRLFAISKIDLLVLDDFCLSQLTDQNRRDLLEILDDRYKKKSTIITSQLEIKHWHAAIGDNTLADAILDRVIHNSHRIELKGESLRKENKRG